jgi:hypothetical protein
VPLPIFEYSFRSDRWNRCVHKLTVLRGVTARWSRTVERVESAPKMRIRGTRRAKIAYLSMVNFWDFERELKMICSRAAFFRPPWPGGTGARFEGRQVRRATGRARTARAWRAR